MNGAGGRRQRREIEVVNEDEKALIWKLPQVKFNEIGKAGPAFGFGVGCGVGFGFGLVGEYKLLPEPIVLPFLFNNMIAGSGFWFGNSWLTDGYGFGAGCGVGIGFGYALGRGVAWDQYKKYSNVGKLAGSWHPPAEAPITALIDELVINTKKLVKATSREVDKWRR